MLPDVVLDELERVLELKLGFDEEYRQEACRLLVSLAAEQPSAPKRVEAVTGDPAGDVILACAAKTGVDVLATGDRKHLPPLAEHHGVRLLTPQAVLAGLRTG